MSTICPEVPKWRTKITHQPQKLTDAQVRLVADLVRFPDEPVVPSLLPVRPVVGDVLVAALAVGIAALREVAEEVEHRLRDSHVLPREVLREEGHPAYQGQAQDVREVLPSYASEALQEKGPLDVRTTRFAVRDTKHKQPLYTCDNWSPSSIVI